MLSLVWIGSLLIGVTLTVPGQAILHGHEAKPNQFPFMVSLPAHCLHGERLNVSNIWAFVGVHHYSNDGQKYPVERIIIHDHFNRTMAFNDASLLQTASPIVCGERVYPIPISREWIKGGQKGVFAGFGVTDIGSGLNPSFLQYISLFVIPNDRCREVHSAKHKDRIDNSILCTFIRHGAGPCRGDSGGILAINNQLVGILSWIVVCEFRLPDQFTRISEFVTWIEEKTHIKTV